MAGTLYLGTSGFAFPEWKGVFYPPEVKAKDRLAYFATRFSSVEVNYTYRHHPSDQTLAEWRARTPDAFRFTLKAHQTITHWRRLKDAHAEVELFVGQARQLGERLGTILFQCPPNLPFDRGLLEDFLAALPSGGRYAMEFRHPSWAEARGMLADRGLAWCTAETDEQAATDPSWEPFGYLRLRKETYREDQLKAWADRVSAALGDGHDVYCYFKHEEKAIGPMYAERLGDLLGASAGRG